MKSKLKAGLKRLLKIRSPFRMAAASSVGLLVGMLPLVGIKIPLLLLIALIFGLNFIAIFAGSMLTLLFPAFHLLSYSLFQVFTGMTVPAFNLRMLSVTYVLAHPDASIGYQFLGAALAGLGLGLVSFPLFKWFYTWREQYDAVTQDYRFIFHDHQGARWGWAKRFIVLFLGVILAVVSVFGISVSINPYLPLIGLKSAKNLAHISALPLNLDHRSKVYQLTHPSRKNSFQLDYKRHSRHHMPLTGRPVGKQLVYGFFVDWDENSLVSLKQNLGHMDVVLPNWYQMKSDGTFNNNAVTTVDALIKGYGVRNMPVINNYVNGQWDGALIHKMITDPATKARFIQSLADDAKKRGYWGVNLDFETLNPGDKDKFTSFVKELSNALHQKGLKVSIDVPASGAAFDNPALADAVDAVIVMMYDEHYQTGTAGPISSQGWFEKTLDALDIPEEKLVVALGSYGYDWNVTSGGMADAATFGDILELVNGYNLRIQWDRVSGNPFMTYTEDGEDHVVWLLDGVTLYNQLDYAVSDGVAGAAVWRLGSEDPSIWHVLGDIGKRHQNRTLLESLSSPVPVHYSGDGEVLRILSGSRAGHRSLSVDQGTDGPIVSETYEKYPVPYEVERYGKPKTKQIVLTFDDGPDPDYTTRILDILKRYNVKASFFIVGENAAANPDLVKRLYAEGHEVGNHTFTHPNVADTTASRTKMELNTTQRLFQELTGHSMIMFRPPYVADAEPSTPNELLPILRAQEQGYMMIGERIDPSDWEQPSSAEIVRRIEKELPLGNVILLHDAGGNRENTVKALPTIIETLKKQGYTFVTIHELLGKPREALMPSVKSADNPFIEADQALFRAAFDWTIFVKVLFYTAIFLGIVRFVFLVAFSWYQKQKDLKKTFIEGFNPKVSVIIAAYNEEKVICKTLASILSSNYDDIEVLVVNDGSSDKTAEVVESTFGDHTQVRLINKPNGGKSSAVNLGFKQAQGEIVICIDADTVLDKEAIGKMVRHFADEGIAAVSGNVKVGNVHNLLTLWQHVEYVTGFNLERRAFAALNCITVVPGAIGAWRKSVVEEAGYLSEDTLAEDTDITLTLLRKGYRISYEEAAYAWTESPADLKSLIKQRYRWSYGTLQCLWKHREALFDNRMKALGFIALPNMWLFQYLFQSLSPIADLYFILGMLGPSPGKIAVFYGAFLLLDYLAAIYAFRLEREGLKPLFGLLIQRVLYRLLMAYVVVKSIVAAFKGITVGWNKLQRQGNVK